MCKAILEDPKGSGKQFIVSQAGQSYALKNKQHQDSFFAHWRKHMRYSGHDFPTLQFIFYLAYEAGVLFESLPQSKLSQHHPLVWWHQPEWSLCFDT
ncbi:MAG: aminodeoxychorismate synthase component I, partial [Ghiorsea sp.]|nr:aminodeoxychorismate synthase component I [Ghiorsea sp.]